MNNENLIRTIERVKGMSDMVERVFRECRKGMDKARDGITDDSRLYQMGYHDGMSDAMEMVRTCYYDTGNEEVRDLFNAMYEDQQENEDGKEGRRFPNWKEGME